MAPLILQEILIGPNTHHVGIFGCTQSTSLKPEEIIVVEDEMISEDIESDYEDDAIRASGKRLAAFEKEDEEEEIFIIVDNMPTFKGKGIEGFREYVIKNLKYPEKAVEEGISGKVFSNILKIL